MKDSCDLVKTLQNPNSEINEEIVLGFDVRADPNIIWANRRSRPHDFLLRDVSQPLSVDSSVWLYQPSDTLDGITSFTLSGWQFSSSDEAKEQTKSGQVTIAVTVRLVGLDQSVREDWLQRAWVHYRPESEWILLGYDIGDQSCLSGLSNCGYGAERDKWKSIWGEDINEHHLVTNSAKAEMLARATDARVPEHAPFAAFGLYLL